jgi:uncharacterized membrane protein YkvA (DUF1232 family)
MSDVDERAIETFGTWLRSLGDDTQAVATVVGNESIAAEVRRPLAGSLNYFLKSLDLIDDGIEGLGFLDDAFVLRIASSNAQAAGQLPESLTHLAGDADLIREALGDIAPRLDSLSMRRTLLTSHSATCWINPNWRLRFDFFFVRM